MQTLWVHLILPDGLAPQSRPEGAETPGAGWLGFLADASDLLAGTLNPAMVPALIAQIVVPRLATWCAVYLVDAAGEMRPEYVWHTDETKIDSLREDLAQVTATTVVPDRSAPVELLELAGSRALIFPLVARGRALGAMCLGRLTGLTDEAVHLAEDLSHRAALAMDNARLYAEQAAANQALQRSLLPPDIPEVPGVDCAVVYEPAGETNEVGGDFYDLFPAGDGRWRFAIGDVCGTGPEAAAVTGLARHTLRLLTREGYDVADIVARLNTAILEEGERARFMTLLHGEMIAGPEGVRLRLVSAGHPEALRLRAGGAVAGVVTAQPLLGVFEEAEYHTDVVDLERGDVLLAVTDGVTERRSGARLLDDDSGLAKRLAECVGLSAGAVAERIRRAVAEFAPEPSADDLAILVLRAPHA
ncbi:PP2C family protein-serine/threonine phosphatase [Rhizohabitans arisaemae]|uniref:PP2C family protein-serine/threonine phosphatase n=1 Tax=Rhizohabitans arisaemae TaxID=2720610 RepID=UPI0024B15DB4|nr:SpoIIE family protein phosphatase [Rhizohabitans arisaemae]